MKMASGPFARRYFDTLHPLTLLCYFVYALIPAMIVSHPVLQTAAVMCGMLLLFAVTGFRAARTTLLFCIPAAAFCMLINALFTHRGITVLFYFPSGNPCTLESLLSGLSLGMTLLSAMLFFAVLSRVMTTEKIVCLFGSVSPALALVLSMSLRFLPHYRQRMSDISAAKAGIAPTALLPQEGRRGLSSLKSAAAKAKDGLGLFSALFAVSTEESLAAADSMRARGYGCGISRTAYSVYTVTQRDVLIRTVLLVCAVPTLYSLCADALSWEYYPYLHGTQDTFSVMLTVCFYSVGILMPVILSNHNHA